MNDWKIAIKVLANEFELSANKDESKLILSFWSVFLANFSEKGQAEVMSIHFNTILSLTKKGLGDQGVRQLIECRYFNEKELNEIHSHSDESTLSDSKYWIDMALTALNPRDNASQNRSFLIKKAMFMDL